MLERLKQFLFGKPRDLRDPTLFHQISLIAFLAWIGLGADGLSSSAYGPDEAYRTLGQHTYLAIWLALATAITVFVISYAYSRIIEHFPNGGGGYVVASKLLGHRAGVVSGCALLVDYMLTITTSVASGGDAVFSFLPEAWLHYKLTVDIIVIIVLIILNLRGVRESVTAMMPIFVLFLVTHVIFIGAGVILRGHEVGAVVHEVRTGTAEGLRTLGFWGLFLIFIKAYSMGGGTYTGIEAVSNGIQIMREPKVQTAKTTMVYMAVSLAVTAGGIILVYMLTGARPVDGKTMNAVALEAIAGRFHLGGFHVGAWFVVLTLVSEGALLFVAAQTGFIDGPRVMANMATDSWFPHRFAALSDRLTMKNGVLLMGLASLALLLVTRGSVDALVVMYSINVFITFSLSELGMVRFWIRNRKTHPEWRQHLPVHLTGLVMCASILLITLTEKFAEGGWLTLAITSLVIALCFLIRWHYRRVLQQLQRLNEILSGLPATSHAEPKPVDPKKPTAILLVTEYGGLGIHSLLNVQRLFPGYFQNFVFVSAGVIDSANFKGSEEVDRLRERTENNLRRYVELANRLGLSATSRSTIGTEAVDETSRLCQAVAKEFPHSVIFGGKLIFEQERWYHRILHNETAHAIQKRVQFAGLPMVILPVRVRDQPSGPRLVPGKAA
ncbi:MAG: APC family permease [Deltaproteobacteria bacterium]